MYAGDSKFCLKCIAMTYICFFDTNRYRTQHIKRRNKKISNFVIQNNDIIEEVGEGKVYKYLGKQQSKNINCRN